ncbi:hypothetical protein RIF29_30021 [Crotalaria pallida]|uniref:Uncharacterized protein n=1 Tax=Crotalaria pallida TaxID=3830 RepID=A0AAN9HWE0_CROPI
MDITCIDLNVFLIHTTKNLRTFKANDEEKFNAGSSIAPAQGVTKNVGTNLEKPPSFIDRVIKRGPGKRSRQEGKHATPNYILLRNVGVKDFNKEGASHIESTARRVLIQPGNFGTNVPVLVKDTNKLTPTGGGVGGNVMQGWDNNEMVEVPETQFAIDPGQTKADDVIMQDYAANGLNDRSWHLRGSPVWNAITKAKSMLSNGFTLKVGAGDVSFFYDKWMDNGPLCNKVPWVAIHDTELRVKVVFRNGAWNFDTVFTLLPSDLQNNIIRSDIMVASTGFGKRTVSQLGPRRGSAILRSFLSL